MRLFVALTFSPGLVEKLSAAQDELRQCRVNVKWVEKENLHLTLKFLGEVSPEKASKIVNALSRGVQGIGELYLEVKGAGVFPSWSRPRVIWIGLTPNPGLLELHRSLERELEALGFPPESFSPHITLGRMRTTTNWSALKESLRRWQEKIWGEERIDRVVLMQSHLTFQGPRYQVMRTFPLT